MSESISLTVTGMKCGGCENNAKSALNALDGIISVEASSKENRVDVEFEPEKADVELISETITKTGYKVE